MCLQELELRQSPRQSIDPVTLKGSPSIRYRARPRTCTWAACQLIQLWDHPAQVSCGRCYTHNVLHGKSGFLDLYAERQGRYEPVKQSLCGLRPQAGTDDFSTWRNEIVRDPVHLPFLGLISPRVPSEHIPCNHAERALCLHFHLGAPSEYTERAHLVDCLDIALRQIALRQLGALREAQRAWQRQDHPACESIEFRKYFTVCGRRELIGCHSKYLFQY